MRIEPRMNFGQFGNVQINALQQVIELDAGYSAQESVADGEDIVVPGPVMAAAEQDMAIIIACMNEEYQTIQGVLSGVPHDCLPILVSNSARPGIGARPQGVVDRYNVEVQLVEDFRRRSRRSAIVVHQGDPGVAAAFKEAGMPELVDEERTGLVHRGKGEAMIIGMAIAALTGRRYVGFVDADNFVPGSVTEYCKVFAAALHSAQSRLAMVRISWNSKPKVRDNRLVFDKKGRSSRVVNEWLNRLLQEYTGYGTDLIVTGNAGEHAMTMELGLRLRLARSYAIEPYEIINILEQFGYAEGSPAAAAAAAASAADHDSGHESDSDTDVVTPSLSLNSNNQHQQPRASSLSASSSSSSLSSRASATELVEIMQVETRNPHFHDTTKGEEHVQDMQLQALKAMYHSPVTPPALRAQLLHHMTENLGCDVDALGEPPRERTYPPLAEALNLGVFADVLVARSTSLRQIGHAAHLDVLLADRAFSGGITAATGAGAGATHRRPRRKAREHHLGAHQFPQFKLQLQVPRRHDFPDDGDSPRSSSDEWETNLQL